MNAMKDTVKKSAKLNDAEEKLKEDIANGRENPPEECYDSGADVIGNGDDN